MKLRHIRQVATLCVVALALLGPSAPAFGEDIVMNGSFEMASVNPGAGFISLPPGSTAITNWTVGGPGATGIDYIGTYWQASDGVRSIDLNNLTPGSVSQVLPTVAGQTYVLTFDMAGNPDGGPVIKTLQVSAGATVGMFSFDITGASRPNMMYQERMLLFTAVGPTTTLTFTSTTAGAFGPVIDNVRGVPIPEPSGVALLTLGVLGVGGYCWRRRKPSVG
jgi:choice-of-anchor C domain-containing protein